VTSGRNFNFFSPRMAGTLKGYSSGLHSSQSSFISIKYGFVSIVSFTLTEFGEGSAPIA